MAAREATVQANIIRGLVDRGAWYTKVHQSGYGRKGIPDVLACYRGVFFAIEVKTETGRLRPEQIRELHRIRDAGGIAIVGRCRKDVEDVMDDIDWWHGREGDDASVGGYVTMDELPPIPKVVL